MGPRPLAIDRRPGEIAVEPFDYSGIGAADAEKAKDIATRINPRIPKHIGTIIETGIELLAIKQIFSDEAFRKWVESECNMSEQTASNYIAAARAFDGKS